MFSAAIQPGLVSLFSSTGFNPLGLFETRTDESLVADAFIGLLNDRSSEPKPQSPVALVSQPPEEGFVLDQTVLHIQSPSLPKTFILCPAQAAAGVELGLKHPWVHLQVRNMEKEWSFEMGISDQTGRKGILRFSTFQKHPRLKVNSSPPLLHLPLSFPPSSSQLTAWSTISLHLPAFLPHFTNTSLIDHVSESIYDEVLHTPVFSKASAPNGQYSHTSYVKIYPTCRLRRIWFSDGGPSQKLPWEFELYARE
ncbi:hypothetical protein BDP27DRAFT_1206204 [Rhodocollybia butyracea]|uniref:CFA20 domain-containing protein n=1 Tax=Rhodocollybia butyracea TaxID=206335 RepID=A0A9P5QCZ0_9AGAR|nr:hypothetical protein BDP27DRAFT_1206204 [Rhodocollybia butyracea]